MVDYTFSANNSFLESRYVTHSEVGVYPTYVFPNTLFTWGWNPYGELGTRNITHRSSPVQIGSMSNWKQIIAGQGYTLAVKTDGTLWAWGFNQYGQLGLGDVLHRSSPVQVGSLNNWSQVSAGSDYNSGIQYFSVAVKTDGTLWGWGSNAFGELGLGDTVPRSSPTQIGSLTNWKQVAAGGMQTLAIKTDGTLWAWGSNSYGQLGYGGGDTSSPVQVGSLNNWSQVVTASRHSAAIKTDGTLWTWGANGQGELGLNDPSFTNRGSPVQVGTLTSWSKVGVGGYSAFSGYTVAIRTNGTLWAWGYNGYGQLGIGDTTLRSSPTQIGALNTWSKIGVSQDHVLAIRTNGTLWAWGRNDYGQLGQGNLTHRSSPVQVGSLNSWAQLNEYGANAVGHSVALTG